MKKIIGWALVVVALIVLIGVGLSFYAKNKINKGLTVQRENGELSYTHLKVNVISGNFSVDSLRYSDEKHNEFVIEQVKGKGFGYWTYLRQRKIHFRKLVLTRPKITITQSDKSDDDQKKDDDFKGIDIGELHMDHADVLLKKDTVSKLHLEDYSMTLSKFKVRKDTSEGHLLFHYDNMLVDGKNAVVDLGVLQTMELKGVKVGRSEATIQKIHLKPKHSKQAYIRFIPHEQDWADVRMDSLKFSDFSMDITDKKKRFSTSLMHLKRVKANIYRDKTIKDDETIKYMYSKVLRDLPILLNIDSLRVDDASLTYEEKQENTEEVGKVYFEKLKVNAGTITNQHLDQKDFPETKVAISCLFYGSAPMDVNWTFRINDPGDHFTFRGDIHDLSAEKLNLFFIPALNMRAKGANIRHIYFNYHGDKNVARGNFKMEYDDLKIDVLKKESKEKSGFLSFLSNIFITHKNKKEEDHIGIEDVKRDPTRSFWNYIWTCTFTGIKATLLP